jgi:hypothetical protein
MRNEITKCLLLSCILSVGMHAHGAWLSQNDKVSLDDSNYLIFQDIGRVTTHDEATSTTGITVGKFVRLRVHRDGQDSNVDLLNESPNQKDRRPDLISSEVKEIRYRDRDRVWLIAREGPLADSAMLLNIVTKKAELRFLGTRFRLSPDASMVAYTDIYLSRDPSQERVIVFVNDAMAFPLVKTFSLKAGVRDQSPDPETPAGVDLYKYARTTSIPRGELTALEWVGPDRLKVEIKAGAQPDKIRTLRYEVSGLQCEGTSMKTDGIKVAEVAAEETKPSDASPAKTPAARADAPKPAAGAATESKNANGK